MEQHEFSEATTPGGTTANSSSQSFPTKGQQSNVSTCGLESGKFSAQQVSESFEQHPHTLGHPQDRTLEEHAQAIQRYREEYDRASSETTYDIAAEEAYREHCARYAQHRVIPKRVALMRSPEIELERQEVIGRRKSWPKPVVNSLPTTARQKASRGTTGASAMFIAIFTLALTPLLDTPIFVAADAFGWIFSAESTAFIAALLAWTIVNGKRSRRRLGISAGIALSIGLGVVRLALWPKTVLFPLMLTCIGITAMLLFACQPARRTSEAKAFS